MGCFVCHSRLDRESRIGHCFAMNGRFQISNLRKKILDSLFQGNDNQKNKGEPVGSPKITGSKKNRESLLPQTLPIG